MINLTSGMLNTNGGKPKLIIAHVFHRWTHYHEFSAFCACAYPRSIFTGGYCGYCGQVNHPSTTSQTSGATVDQSFLRRVGVDKEKKKQHNKSTAAAAAEEEVNTTTKQHCYSKDNHRRHRVTFGKIDPTSESNAGFAALAEYKGGHKRVNLLPRSNTESILWDEEDPISTYGHQNSNASLLRVHQPVRQMPPTIWHPKTRRINHNDDKLKNHQSYRSSSKPIPIPLRPTPTSTQQQIVQAATTIQALERAEQRELYHFYNRSTVNMFLLITQYRRQRGICTRPYTRSTVDAAPMMPSIDDEDIDDHDDDTTYYGWNDNDDYDYGGDHYRHPEIFDMEI